MNNYYTAPMQVRFWRIDENRYEEGIVFHDYVVALRDGKAFAIRELMLRSSKSEDDTIIEYAEWWDLNLLID